MVSVVALQGCQILDGVDQSAPDQDASSIEITSLPVAPAYPKLRTVPPRPQLSYSVEQHREIVERLIGDREHARYTSQQVRYRTGLSSLPPPPRPEPEDDAASATAEAIVGDGQATLESPAPRADVPTAAYGATSDPGVTDDGDLGDFIREMIEDTEPPPPAPSDAPAPPASNDSSGVQTSPKISAAPASHSSAAPPSGDPSATRLFAWIDDLKKDAASARAVSAEPEDASPEPEASPPAGAVPVQAAALPQPDGAPASAAREIQVAAASEPAAMVPDTNGEAQASLDEAGGPSPSPPPAAAVAAQPKPEPDTAAGPPPAGAALATITFADGSAKLPAGTASRLQDVLGALKGSGGIEIVGQGKVMTLALDRARAVAVGLMRLGAGAGDLKIAAETAPADQVRILVGGRPPGD